MKIFTLQQPRQLKDILISPARSLPLNEGGVSILAALICAEDLGLAISPKSFAQRLNAEAPVERFQELPG